MWVFFLVIDDTFSTLFFLAETLATDRFVIDQVIDTAALDADILGYYESTGVHSTLRAAVHPPYQHVRDELAPKTIAKQISNIKKKTNCNQNIHRCVCPVY